MSDFEVRPFRRADREQVTRLVNTHAAAVMPGAAASVNAVLNQFEREPDEFIVGPWVGERQTMVAEQDGSVVAAALLVRHRDGPDVGEAFRNAGEIRWLLFWPMAPAGNPYWSDGQAAAQGLMDACLGQLVRWQVSRLYADGALPVPGVYGVPEQWPHIARLYTDNGFAVALDGSEILHLADLADLPGPGEPPLPGLELRRLVGINGTRLSAHLGQTAVGYIEVEVVDPAERHTRHAGLADIGNLQVIESHRRQGVGTWLLRHAAQWLRLGHVDRLLHYAAPEETAEIAFVERNRFSEITRTRRGWERPV
jgi:GNAT superfamily N-acetyltransferase